MPIAKTVKEAAIKYAPVCFTALGEIVQDRKAPHSARVSAASTLLDRAYGRAPQDVTVRGQIEQHIIQLIQGLDQMPEQSEIKPDHETAY